MCSAQKEIMRRCLIYLFLLLPLQMVAQPVYFCTKQGATLNYVRKYADSGEVKWYHTLKVTSVIERNDSTVVTTMSDFVDDSGESVMDFPIAQYVRISNDGTIKLELTDAVVAILHSKIPVGHAKKSGEAVELTAGMKPGDILPSAQAQVSMLGLKYTVNVTDRKVLRNESITTPAGTFDCVVISEHKVERAPAYKRETTAISWYADGIGYVRHDTYNKNMVLETTEYLESVK